MPQSLTCGYCDERIFDNESYIDTHTRQFHRECIVRMVVGSAAHQLRECPCYGGLRGDPLGMSLREAARLSADAFILLAKK